MTGFGGLVKWDHASMAWMSQEFDSPILHQYGLLVQLDRTPVCGTGGLRFKS